MAVMIPVCARCRCPLGEGMRVMIFSPNRWRQFQELDDTIPLRGRLEPGNDDPVVACYACGAHLQRQAPPAGVH